MSKEPSTVLITANNLVSRLMVTRVLNYCPQDVAGIVILPNLNLSTEKGRRLTKKWFSSASIYFYYYKLVEIVLDTLIAKIQGTSISHVATKKQVPLKKLSTQSQELLFSALAEWNYDFIISMGPAILSKAVIDSPKIKCLNIHGGDLPSYRGLSNYVWMLLNSEKEAIVTLHEMVEKIDAGRNLNKLSVFIENDWSAFRLNYEMAKVQGDLAINFLRSERILNFMNTGESELNRYHGLPSRDAIKRLRAMNKFLIKPRDLGLIFRRVT
jgi:folate-dependent phosphoribosylglycinamide formyltransferase PurN